MITLAIAFAWAAKPALCQQEGIKFATIESLEQIKKIAQKEHKMIFLDMYATWCGPCKAMDMVYLNDTLGKYINKNFVSTKVQIDRTAKDNENIQKMYSFAKSIQNQYKLKSIPAYIFLDENGEITHIDNGLHTLDGFKKIAATALDNSENFRGLLAKYKIHKLSNEKYTQLAHYLLALSNDSLAWKVIRSYKTSVLDKKKPDEVINGKFAELLQEYPALYNIHDNLIRYVYAYQQKSDSLFGRTGISNTILSYFIRRDIITPYLVSIQSTKMSPPQWDSLQTAIQTSWGKSLSENTVTEGKLTWYSEKQKWDSVAKYQIHKIEKNGIPSNINNIVWDYFFKKTNNSVFLRKAQQYIEEELKKNPNDYYSMDTYANILYKLQNNQEALSIEKKALALAESKNDLKQVKVLIETIEKMQKGLPTWLD